MSEGKRLDYLKDINDGLDAKDRILGDTLKERINKENDATLKERKRVQDDEQTKIDLHSEGYCYGCSTYDKILSTLIYSCKNCMRKRGIEGLMQIVYYKTSHELCDFCGEWIQGVYQINISLCNKCMKKLAIVHKNYKKRGGQKQNPYNKLMVKMYGNDYNEILGHGFTRDQTKSQKWVNQHF